eukprot:CAMPEP_0183432378 /NCGR_PEP_ID=MMETSP0370-20130417/57169_1 /TAXON_ID=268820 /ORGANISM="Peridinium aciculiferum, Strain PAER-2" /LENGTH=325 /DNA_ID=CAMNT_0025618329 /DNA_START=51 /DNA_END=1031 /DNA_ORIENTATION=-
MSVLVIGAGGAVGKRLVAALSARGERIVAVDRAPELPESLRSKVTHAVTNADVRDFSTINRIFKRHRFVHTVWNLAAPLSVETALNPTVAEQVTVNGMRNVLWAMYEARIPKIMFTDSIGSFGATAPRDDCTARWLTEHPLQDPGSDYGRQKRAVRRLLHEFWRTGGDPRWAVLPGVLHSESAWGKGTTEYALEALLAAATNEPFVCRVDPEVRLPMIFVDDLMRGLLSLQDTDARSLREPERGYCIPGFSFTANELFDEIQLHVPDFKVTVELDPNMDKFSRLWPDTLSTREPRDDLGYEPRVGLREMVFKVLMAHRERLAAQS